VTKISSIRRPLQELAVVVNFAGDDDDDTRSSPLPYGDRGGSGAGGMGLPAVRRNPPLFSKSPASLLLLSKLLTLYC
jgi:hypothetical protein